MKTKLPTLLLLSILLLAACNPAATQDQDQPPVLSPTQAPTAYAPPSNKPYLAATQLAASPAGEVSINISGFKFDPASVTVKVGTTLTWTNQDTATHTVKANDGSWSSDNLMQADTFSQAFTQAGAFAYTCGIHPSMVGIVIVEP